MWGICSIYVQYISKNPFWWLEAKPRAYRVKETYPFYQEKGHKCIKYSIIHGLDLLDTKIIIRCLEKLFEDYKKLEGKTHSCMCISQRVSNLHKKYATISISASA